MAFFFKKFPKTDYAFINTPSQKKNVQNILTAFFLKKVNSYKSVFFQKYTIKDDDSIESLSQKLYEDPMHYWTLLIVNDIINPYYEWSIQSDAMENFVKLKYKNGKQFMKSDGTVKTIPISSGIEGIHHFYNNHTGRICDDVDDEHYRQKYLINPISIGNNIIPVTNLQYENEVNLERRNINIVAKTHIINFEENFNNMLTGRIK